MNDHVGQNISLLIRLVTFLYFYSCFCQLNTIKTVLNSDLSGSFEFLWRYVLESKQVDKVATKPEARGSYSTRLFFSQTLEIRYRQCLFFEGVRLFQPDAADGSNFETRGDNSNEVEADNVTEMMVDEQALSDFLSMYFFSSPLCVFQGIKRCRSRTRTVR